MKKFLVIIIMFIVLTGCSKNEFIDFKDKYIEDKGITDVEEVLSYGDVPYIEGVIFKGRINGNEENLFYSEGLAGTSEGIYSNGEYTAGLLHIEEGMIYQVYEGENYGYDNSYFVGIAYRKMSDVYYKGKSIDFKTKDICLNDEDITLTVWLMPFTNGEDISITDFEYKE